jgi:hypothetical protein
MKTRTGKIARLPRGLRDQLNARLENGEPGHQLVVWLNSLPQVQDLLQAQFAGRPISEQNLSEWKQGGYLDWCQHQEIRDLVSQLSEQAGDLDGADGFPVINHHLAALLSVEFVRVSQALLNDGADPRQRWQRLRELLQTLSALRRDDHQAARLLMDQERYHRDNAQRDERDEKQTREDMKDQVLAPIMAALEANALAPFLGDGLAGRRIAAKVAKVIHDLKPGALSSRLTSPVPSPNPVSPNQAQSNPIKPNQTSCTFVNPQSKSRRNNGSMANAQCSMLNAQ